MTAFLNDRDVAARVLGHIDGSTTDRGEEVWREPVANYRSPERLEREIGVLRGSAAAFCPSTPSPHARTPRPARKPKTMMATAALSGLRPVPVGSANPAGPLSDPTKFACGSKRTNKVLG